MSTGPQRSLGHAAEGCEALSEENSAFYQQNMKLFISDAFTRAMEAFTATQ